MIDQIPSLIPYANPIYFAYVLIALIPLIAYMLWKEKRLPWYQSIVTLVFLYISFGGSSWKQGVALILYVVWQTVLVALYQKYRQKHNQSGVFYASIILAILPLFLTKLFPVFDFHISFIGFLGISYLTFKSVQVIIEFRDGVLKTYKIWDYIRFLLFFPTISSGPIDRFRRFQKELHNAPLRSDYADLLKLGVHRIFIGFLYKFIIGYYLGTLALPHLEKAALDGGLLSWQMLLYMYGYSLFLFFDFAGYSLFAVGVSNLMGYKTPMNFNKPFASWNIKEFWNRWHISLSTWFRDYVYMRLMFLLVKKKLFKSRVVASNIGYFGLFLLMGFWHGFTWFYILYGVFHATAICVNDWWLRLKKKHKNWPSNKWTHALAVVVTFHVVCASFLIFSGILDKLFFN
ncbi:D-alanyl-lipoteichoic acid biosynthesis protein DltB [Kurthia senegalensis]|uniref:D-alanyl-lipoteichoic acid biosynthesis protein DltB n=1 Tax=Kurthia senegalensis TaxID=1033740 RepID=UPI000288F027|nr:D-alanyl-lipoteichoic acid biosynthesis protein DltB [Kurthia senegalensis]